jgi:hypothetical protein
LVKQRPRPKVPGTVGVVGSNGKRRKSKKRRMRMRAWRTRISLQGSMDLVSHLFQAYYQVSMLRHLPFRALVRFLLCHSLPLSRVRTAYHHHHRCQQAWT